jgi:hypothetical protein
MKKIVFSLLLSTFSSVVTFGAVSESVSLTPFSEDPEAAERLPNQFPTLSLVKILRNPHAPIDEFLLVFNHGVSIIATQYINAKEDSPRYKVLLPGGGIMYLLYFGNIVLRRLQREKFCDAGPYQKLTTEDCVSINGVGVQEIDQFSQCLYEAQEGHEA